MVAGRPTRALLTLCAVRLLRRPRDSVLLASQERTLDFGRALCGLRVELPYAGWGGEYAQSTQVAMGMVIKYDGRYQLFDIRFPPELQSADVNLGVAQ